MSDAVPATPQPDQPSDPQDQTLEPPKTLGGILRKLGPGLIIAGSIVGSGELIATTAVGAEAGFVLMWLIIIGCVIKVFVQIEFGKYAITHGKTTLDGMNEVPGPRLGLRPDRKVNWVCWFWLIFIVVALAQVGGLIGGVGQALSIQAPLTEQGRASHEYQSLVIRQKVTDGLIARYEQLPDSERRLAELAEEGAAYDKQLEALEASYAERAAGKADTVEPPTDSNDPLIWATLITLGSIVILVVGRYRLIQNVSTALVASFTLITVINLVLLQLQPDWRVTWSDLVSGMSFRVPPGDGLKVALMAFGIIGVGATELIQYPYWCLEKGYARWTGPRDDSAAWAERAEGWLRVLKWDAWCSMVVYTFATIAFYLLGAAILGRTGLDPSGSQMVRTLGEMYVPVFGPWAQVVFIFGAFAVLYSTFFVATASHALVLADALRVFGLSRGDEVAFRFWNRVFCAALPLLFLGCFAFFKAPQKLVLAGGFMGALMLPLLGLTALYARYRRCDDRLLPSRVWDVFLWLSVLGLTIAGGWAFYTSVIVPLRGA